MKSGQLQFVVCVDNSEYPVSLELHKLYRHLPDADAAADGDIRIVDESGEDYLYPAKYFIKVDVPRHAVPIITKSFGHAVSDAA